MTDLQIRWEDAGDWITVPGISRIAIEEQHQPIEEEYFERWLGGHGPVSMTGILANLPWTNEPTPIERALTILAPHLAEEPLYQPY